MSDKVIRVDRIEVKGVEASRMVIVRYDKWDGVEGRLVITEEDLNPLIGALTELRDAG